MNEANCTTGEEQVKAENNPLNERFERFSADSICANATAREMNDVQRALQGITAITQILLANGVAEDCDTMPLTGYLAGGLIAAAHALSSYAGTSVDRLADLCDRKAARKGVANAV